jgi:hypothetical protein
MLEGYWEMGRDAVHFSRLDHYTLGYPFLLGW